MYEIIVLFEGYSTKVDARTQDANCSCTLIKGPKNIIVDTLTAWDRDKLLAALKEQGLQPEDINYVICTHGHADHVGNNNLFTEAEEHVVGTSVQKRTLFYEKYMKDKDYEICENVKIMATPGHTEECISVIVNNGKFKDKEYNTIVMTGDLFEKKEDIEDAWIWINNGAEHNRVKQGISRHLVATFADLIIPGHGPAFEVTDSMRKAIEVTLDGLFLSNH